MYEEENKEPLGRIIVDLGEPRKSQFKSKLYGQGKKMKQVILNWIDSFLKGEKE